MENFDPSNVFKDLNQAAKIVAVGPRKTPAWGEKRRPKGRPAPVASSSLNPWPRKDQTIRLPGGTKTTPKDRPRAAGLAAKFRLKNLYEYQKTGGYTI